MEIATRVLGYFKASVLTHDEMNQVGGGSAQFSLHGTQKITGAVQGADVEFDQVWD